MGLAMMSCDDFLDKSPLDQIPNDNAYWSTAANVETQTNRLYNNILGYGNGGSYGSYLLQFP